MTDKKLSSEEIQRLFEQDKAERLEKCRSEIEVILQKHKCQLVATSQSHIENGIIRVTSEVQMAILP